MRYIIILGDGMADEPLESLGGKTPLEYANTPVMDLLASEGEIGLAKTVPDSMKPGSDVANLAVLGYDPEKNYSGRSPLEALSVRVPMEPDDIVFRCNIVTLSEDEPYSEKKINVLKKNKYETHFIYTVKADEKDKLQKIIIVPRYYNHKISSPLVLNFDGTQYTDTSVLNSILKADYAVYSKDKWVIYGVKKYSLGTDGVFKNISNIDKVQVLDGEKANTAFKIMNYSTKRDRELNNSEITEYISLLKKENLNESYDINDIETFLSIEKD